MKEWFIEFQTFRCVWASFVMIVVGASGCTAFGQMDAGSATSAMAVNDVLTTADRSINHPRLLFELDDIPALREKSQQGWLALVRAALLAQADQAMAKPILTYQADGIEIAIQRQVLSLAMAGYLTGDPKYIQQGVKILIAQAESTDVRKDFPKILNIGVTAHTYAMGYDWLAPFMTETQRQTMRDELHEVGQCIVERGETEVWASDEPSRLSHNWTGVIYGGLGLVAAVMEPRQEQWLKLSLKKCRGHLDHLADPTGAPWESLAYINYGLLNVTPLAVAMQRENAEPLLPASGGARHLTEFALYTMIPWGRGTVPINQMGAGHQGVNFTDTGWWLAWVNAHDDPTAFWTFRRCMGLDRESADPSDYGLHNATQAYLILWADPSLEARSPDDAHRPLSKRFDRGIVAMRSGWGDMDALATFVAGPGIEGIWNHHDSNSFTFYSRGDLFAADLGSKGGELWLSKFHNIVLVDGSGYAETKGWKPVPGTITDFTDQDGVAMVTGDAREAYPQPFQRATRHMLFARGPQPYIVLVDDIQKDDKPHTYTWQMFTDIENHVETSDHNFEIIGGRSESHCFGTVVRPTSARIARDEAASPAAITIESEAIEPGFIVVLTACGRNEEPPRVEAVNQQGADADIRVSFADGTVDVIAVRKGRIAHYQRDEAGDANP